MKYSIAILFLVFISLNSLAAQQFLDQTLSYDGETREYKIYIPASYDGHSDYPLLFNFHGGGGDIDSQVALADMRSIADTADFILVYPQALPDPNDGGSTNWLHKEPTDVDDVFFVDEMINTISSQYSVDENRIYACGYSLGGEFTYELVCRLNARIAAVGAVARTMGTAAFNNCAPSHPTGILTILGTDDSISPYDGLEWNGVQYYLSADDMHNYWINYNNTSSQAIVTPLPNSNTIDGSTVEHYKWADGDACVSVEHLKVIDGGHDWPGYFGNMDIDASVEIWNYVSKYDLSGLINCSTSSIHFGEIEKIEQIIYPNPASQNISIDLELTESKDYEIYSTNGKLIQSGKIDSSNTTIDLKEIPSDTYILRIEDKLWKFVMVK